MAYLTRLGPNACHHQAAGGCRHRGYLVVAALVNGIVSGHLCGLASTLGAVRDEQVRYLSALLSAQGAWVEHLNALYCALLLMGHAWMERAAS